MRYTYTVGSRLNNWYGHLFQPTRPNSNHQPRQTPPSTWVPTCKPMSVFPPVPPCTANAMLLGSFFPLPRRFFHPHAHPSQVRVGPLWGSPSVPLLRRVRWSSLPAGGGCVLPGWMQWQGRLSGGNVPLRRGLLWRRLRPHACRPGRYKTPAVRVRTRPPSSQTHCFAIPRWQLEERLGLRRWC